MNQTAQHLNSHQVRCHRVLDVAMLAEEAFKHHDIHCLLDNPPYRHYQCYRWDGSNIYRFHVTTFPGTLVVNGDIGTMVWERFEDMFEWAPNAIQSIDYFEEKVPHGIETRVFDADVARSALTECLENLEQPELGEKLEKVAWCKTFLDDEQHRFEAEVYESGLFDGCDFPDFTTFSPRFLWCREALKWFFENKSTGTE